MKTFAIYVGVDDTTTPLEVVKSLQGFLAQLSKESTLPEKDLVYEAEDCIYPDIIGRLVQTHF